MRFTCHMGLLGAAVMGLMLAVPIARAQGEAPSAAVSGATYGDEWEGLRARLGSTNEEWSVIYPQVRRIGMLREDVYATAGTAGTDRRGILGGALDSPMGGTSLNAPVMANRGGGGASGRDKPFDPKNAPGAPTASVGIVRGLIGRLFIEAIMPDEHHPVQTALTELQTMLSSQEVTDDQIRERLAAVRAVRNKARRDLAAAQKELAPYLTVEQMAVLVSLGYLD